MLSNIISLIAGIIFSVGLAISGMVNPDKVKGFLNIFGNWDYALIFVMGGAVLFNFFSFKILANRKPICAQEHLWPTKKEVDYHLLIGSALFGMGWGLVGICPGPAIANIVTLDPKIFTFIAAMLAGMMIHKKWFSKI